MFESNLVNIRYIRGNDIDDIKSAIVTERQVSDIKNLSDIRIVDISTAPYGSMRDYILR